MKRMYGSLTHGIGPLLALFGAAVALTASASAQACAVNQGNSLMHDALPEPLPPQLVVLSVIIPDLDERKLRGDGLEAIVTGSIQGRVLGDRVLLRHESMTSCDDPFRNGNRGLVIGVVQGEEGGKTIVDPILIPNGWVLRQTGSGLTIGQINAPGVTARRDRVADAE